MAELILREHRVRFALGIRADAPNLALQAGDLHVLLGIPHLRSAELGGAESGSRPLEEHRSEQEVARDGARIDGPDGAGSEAHREPAAGDQPARGAHPAGSSVDRCREARRQVAARCEGGLVGRDRRSQRVVDRLVADLAAPAPGQRNGGGRQRSTQQDLVDRLGIAHLDARLDQGCAVQGAGRATDRCDEAIAHRAEQRSRCPVGGRTVEQLLDGRHAQEHVVAVIAVTQHGVEARQPRFGAPDRGCCAP